MNDPGSDPGIDRVLAEMVRSLRELEAELGARSGRGPLGPPTPSTLTRFASEVAIPGAILALRVNIETLKLLQRTLRMADGRTATRASEAEFTDRTRRVTRAALERLDDGLLAVRRAVEGRPPDDEARRLIERVRSLQADVEAQLDATGELEDPPSGGVPVDVDAELESIRESIDGADDPEDGPAPEEGDDDSQDPAGAE
jgi:hypothetical protein